MAWLVITLLLALICSAISEWTAGILALRARMLRGPGSLWLVRAAR